MLQKLAVAAVVLSSFSTLTSSLCNLSMQLMLQRLIVLHTSAAAVGLCNIILQLQHGQVGC
jgi:hypothetical protein